jgi:hypothetical protein
MSDPNAVAVGAMLAASPVLRDVVPALDALPGMTPRTILTSGAPLPWSAYSGGQRRAILGAALFEGLAGSLAEADTLLSRGEILVQPCHDHGCVGSVTGVTSASMPVLVVEDSVTGRHLRRVERVRAPSPPVDQGCARPGPVGCVEELGRDPPASCRATSPRDGR